MEKEKISTLIHSAVGVGAGVLSSLVGRPIYGAIAAFVILYATGKATELVVEKEGFKWWMGNGVVPFIFLWLMTWVFFFNL